ncbi:serine hydrolase domain-containing protein [Nocardioides aestuarii]|uniref:Serine hydrolase domain-containing protein n=1 Tax=Nocardioides aestuarii TaxID=252231 RepID=A0ABW4TS24_9ACTN
MAGAGTVRGLDQWVTETSTTSLLVLDRGTVVHEWYAAGLEATTRFLGASMTKSALAHLVGRAVDEGALDLDDPVADHVPELGATGWRDARVLDVLTMTSGVDWVEDHRDPDTPASRLVGSFAEGRASRDVLLEVGSEAAPGTRWTYCTGDSQVLDWVRERATDRPFAADLALLWADLGCTEDAHVAVDGDGVALAGGGLAATSRDWSRLGLHAAAGAWADAAARPAYGFTAPGRLPSTITAHVGFGRHWWPLDDHGDRVAADGSRGQFVAVDRRTGATVVKTSLWPYDDAWADRQHRDLSYLGLHALLDHLDPDPEGEPRP